MQETPPLQLLLIEDNPGDARYIEELLEGAAELTVRVRERADGAGAVSDDVDRASPILRHESRLDDGLEYLADSDVDAVLLDLDLPDSSGLDTLTAVRDRIDVPVIVLTGHRDREVGTAALGEGAEEYLVKDEINGDLLVRSLYHAIERRTNERELKRQEVLLEESTDVNAILEPDGTVQYITPSVEPVLGYEPAELVGAPVFDYVHPDDREQTTDALEAVLDGRTPTVEFRFERPDGSWVILEGRGRNLQDDPLVEGVAVYTRDVTERVARTEQLERQREQLAALNDLNAVVRDINEAVIDQSTREEVEQLVVDRLAESESYRFAWIGSVDLRTNEVTPHVEAGVGGYLDDIDISIDEEDATGQGPTATTVRTGEMQVVDDVEDDPSYEPWRDRAREHEFRSSAAIPVGYQGTLYGVLNVYANRPNAFEGQERDVVGQLGGTIGHAINAIERKQVLESEEVLEVEFTDQKYLESHGLPEDAGTITINRAVPIGGGSYVVYGTATEDALETLDALCESIDYWDEVTVSGGGDTYRFELNLTQPPVISRLAERGGRLHRAVIEAGAYHLVVHLPPSADVRQFAEIIQEGLPDAQLIAQRQTIPEERTLPSLAGDLEERLTVRQQNVLEASYYAGFFEWPREKNGEEIADSLDVSAPTFHQHLRAGERKLLESVFEDE